MKFQESLYSLGYPAYGARFLNESVLLVAGGGGEGNNGIPNKLTALQVNFEKRKVIKRYRELTLDENDDSPTTLDAANNVILMGCNESSAKIKAGADNHHLRKYVFENDHLKFVASVDMDRSGTCDDYTKLTYMSQDGTVAAIASSKLPTVIRILNPNLLAETYEIETGNDVKDLHFSPDGKVLSYITSSTLEVISIVTGRFIVRKTDFDKNWALSKIRFIAEDTVLIAAALKKGNGIVLCKVSLKSGSTSVLKTKTITTKFKGVTSMDVDPAGQLAALAGNDNSIVIVRLKNFTIAKFFKQVHSFAVTRVVFSPNGKILASVSAANTIHVISIPDKLATATSVIEKIIKLFINFVLIVFIAAIAQVTYKYDLHSKTYHFALNKWNSRKDSFRLNDVFRQTTLVGDVISIETHTRLAPTEDYSVTTSFSSSELPRTLSSVTASENSFSAEDFTSTHSLATPTSSYLVDESFVLNNDATIQTTKTTEVVSESGPQVTKLQDTLNSGTSKLPKMDNDAESTTTGTPIDKVDSAAIGSFTSGSVNDWLENESHLSNVPLDADSLQSSTKSANTSTSNIHDSSLTTIAHDHSTDTSAHTGYTDAEETEVKAASNSQFKSSTTTTTTVREATTEMTEQHVTSLETESNASKVASDTPVEAREKKHAEPNSMKAGRLTSKNTDTSNIKTATPVNSTNILGTMRESAINKTASQTIMSELHTSNVPEDDTLGSAKVYISTPNAKNSRHSDEIASSLRHTSSWEDLSSSPASEQHASNAIPDDFENKFTPDVSSQNEKVDKLEETIPNPASKVQKEPATVEEVKPVPESTADTQVKSETFLTEDVNLASTGASREEGEDHSDEALTHDEL
ncbi:LANO_0A01684g1_1 [Lachancea nothofagi CBS 11611]|uniref:Guanine nucleotide-exchange factor SEC12 n=1 Tax=Lachancea nothofagi CBS 11611 TaxID=1266666 RepID=A0A1G4IMW2_9SACH|nr:LANO_0A01684g1_1 [Lachancea nothofagi CBS 11611]